MQTALVTGGAGFLGTAIARALRDAGYAVGIAGTGSDSDPLTRERIAALAPADVIVHCAGSSSVQATAADPAREHAKTVRPFALLLEHVSATAPSTRVALLSSAAVYGDARELPTPETCPLAPVSVYGQHKLECEQLCARHAIASVVLRLFSVYGPGLRKQLLWDACSKARAGQLVFGGTGDEERDWLHVDDAAALVVRALPHASSAVFTCNGASGIGVRVRDVVEQVARELGGGAPRFTGEHRAGDPTRYLADVTRARGLGWAPRIDLERGISEYVAWFREQG